jgi:hypothetical protein
VVKLPWLWLNEVALIVAERIAKEQPRRFNDTASALYGARQDLLGWAHRGALEVQGKYWSLPEAVENSTYFDDQDWVAIKASLWEPGRLWRYAAAGQNKSDPTAMNRYISVNWPDNILHN